jgi:glycosyltransferase involved in cell wall biosynthesis
MQKKKVLLQTDFSLAKTGFGRNAKSILRYLYKTNKYDIVHYCCGINWSHPELKRTPWKSVGSLPDNQQELEQINRDPNLARMASYGQYNLDKIIEQEKPDVYIATQDIWGVDFAIDKPWFNKINSVIWTTLDSLPILPSAIEKAPKIKNYWIWSDFATKELHRMGFSHVKTVHGSLEEDKFYKLSDEKRLNLRKENNIPEDAFIVGFVFRNQLRKSVPNLLEGYANWKKENPNIKNTYLLLHTHWGEGWNIHKLAEEYGINNQEILTTYVCKNCGNYEIKPFSGQDLNCKFCKAEKSQITTNVGLGVSEEQLNEVYNLMDVYCHPFTSGGQEIPIQEAKLTELITLVTNYSCGEEMCYPEAESLPLDWFEYREHGTEFKKASTDPKSITIQINKVFNMSKEERSRMGKKARDWTIKNFSVNAVGKTIENFIDSCGKVDHSSSFSKEVPNPNALVPEINDNEQWILFLYHNILNLKNIDKNDDGFKHWMQQISQGAKRIDIENYFRQVAQNDLQKMQSIQGDAFEAILGKDDKGKRVLMVMPESAGDVLMLSSLFPSFKKVYPDYNLYIATKPEYKSILDGNEYVYKVLDYNPQMDNLLWLEGHGDHQGYFEIAFLPHVGTQRLLNYLHNGKDKIEFEIKNQ